MSLIKILGMDAEEAVALGPLEGLLVAAASHPHARQKVGAALPPRRVSSSTQANMCMSSAKQGDQTYFSDWIPFPAPSLAAPELWLRAPQRRAKPPFQAVTGL